MHRQESQRHAIRTGAPDYLKCKPEFSIEHPEPALLDMRSLLSSSELGSRHIIKRILDRCLDRTKRDSHLVQMPHTRMVDTRPTDAPTAQEQETVDKAPDAPTAQEQETIDKAPDDIPNLQTNAQQPAAIRNTLQVKLLYATSEHQPRRGQPSLLTSTLDENARNLRLAWQPATLAAMSSTPTTTKTPMDMARTRSSPRPRPDHESHSNHKLLP